MSDNAWIDRNGRRWFGYWHSDLKGRWSYNVRPEGADNDMGDLDFEELQKYFGPVRHEDPQPSELDASKILKLPKLIPTLKFTSINLHDEEQHQAFVEALTRAGVQFIPVPRGIEADLSPEQEQDLEGRIETQRKSGYVNRAARVIVASESSVIKSSDAHRADIIIIDGKVIKNRFGSVL